MVVIFMYFLLYPQNVVMYNVQTPLIALKKYMLLDFTVRLDACGCMLSYLNTLPLFREQISDLPSLLPKHESEENPDQSNE